MDSRFIQASTSTSSVSASWTTAGIRPLSSKLRWFLHSRVGLLEEHDGEAAPRVDGSWGRVPPGRESWRGPARRGRRQSRSGGGPARRPSPRYSFQPARIEYWPKWKMLAARTASAWPSVSASTMWSGPPRRRKRRTRTGHLVADGGEHSMVVVGVRCVHAGCVTKLLRVGEMVSGVCYNSTGA